MEPKNSFVMYTEYRQHIERLTDEAAGRLLKAVMEFAAGEQPAPMDGAEGMAFSFICAQVERDDKKYRETQKKRSEAGKLGGRPPKARQAIAFPAFAAKAQNPVDATVSAHANDTANDTVSAPGTGNDAGANAPGPGFAAFWAAYPRKTGKRVAETAWQSLSPGGALQREILSALRQQARSAQWKKDGGQFIPNPARWLAERRWEDTSGKPADFLAMRSYVPLPRTGKPGNQPNGEEQNR